MKISRIYVVACAWDFHLTKLCVTSIRYWYPDIPISIIKDEGPGCFDTSALQRDWKIDLFSTTVKHFGTGYGKLEVLCRTPRERYLMLDSDLILLGPVLNAFRKSNADFIVSPERCGPEHISMMAYDLKLLAEFDPGFHPPDYCFNTGQYVATSGLFTRQDLETFLEWTEPRTNRHPHLFKYSEQGITNYLLFKGVQTQRCSLDEVPFYRWGGMDCSDVTLSQVREKKSPPHLLHWAGPKAADIRDMPRADLLFFYRDFYEWHSGKTP